MDNITILRSSSSEITEIAPGICVIFYFENGTYAYAIKSSICYWAWVCMNSSSGDHGKTPYRFGSPEDAQKDFRIHFES